MSNLSMALMGEMLSLMVADEAAEQESAVFALAVMLAESSLLPC